MRGATPHATVAPAEASAQSVVWCEVIQRDRHTVNRAAASAAAVARWMAGTSAHGMTMFIGDAPVSVRVSEGACNRDEHCA
jgi:antirestriction protein ArdC